MNKYDEAWIKARLKTHRECISWVLAGYWRKTELDNRFVQRRSCIPFLERSLGPGNEGTHRFSFFEIKNTGGLIVLPNWIDLFESEDLIPPAEWKDPD